MLKQTLALVGLTLSLSSNAAIIDMGNITRDTTAGLDWLDLTETNGRSYNDISSRFGVEQEFEGWRYASSAELETLLINFGIPSDEINTNYGEDNSLLVDVISLLGNTENSTLGILSDLYLGPEIGGIPAHSSAIISTFYTTIPNGGQADDSSQIFIGSFLVKSSEVPIPAAAWLFSSALIGLAGIKRKK